MKVAAKTKARSDSKNADVCSYIPYVTGHNTTDTLLSIYHRVYRVLPSLNLHKKSSCKKLKQNAKNLCKKSKEWCKDAKMV